MMRRYRGHWSGMPIAEFLGRGHTFGHDHCSHIRLEYSEVADTHILLCSVMLTSPWKCCPRIGWTGPIDKDSWWLLPGTSCSLFGSCESLVKVEVVVKLSGGIYRKRLTFTCRLLQLLVIWRSIIYRISLFTCRRCPGCHGTGLQPLNQSLNGGTVIGNLTTWNCAFDWRWRSPYTQRGARLPVTHFWMF